MFVALVVVPLAAWFALSCGAVRAQAPSPARAISVTATPAKVRDVPVDLRNLGTVQAFNIVQIRARVNGTLIAIPVKEGDEVHQGDVVAEIDPRPYKAALDQATAKHAEDAAQLQ